METEVLLLNAAKKMDKDALAKIFDLYGSVLYNYALRLCGDPLLADHIVGDVFVKLFDQFAAGSGPTSNLRAYLFQITYHKIVDEARYSHRWTSLDAVADIRSGLLGLEDQVMFNMILEAIQRDLNDDQRHVILLRFLGEFSLRETASILGKEISHVKVIQGRALAKLRNVFLSKEIKTAMTLPKIRRLSKALSI